MLVSRALDSSSGWLIWNVFSRSILVGLVVAILFSNGGARPVLPGEGPKQGPNCVNFVYTCVNWDRQMADSGGPKFRADFGRFRAPQKRPSQLCSASLSGLNRLHHRLKNLRPIGAANPLITGAIGVGHQSENIALAIADAGNVFS